MIRGAENVLALCESPIEKRLFAGIAQIAGMHEKDHIYGNWCFTSRGIVKGPWEICPQWQIENGLYRLDFGCLFELRAVLAIECDGFEWHHKTKDQVDNDNKRQRHLLSHGIATARFSGREITNHVFEAAENVLSILEALQP